MSRQEASPYRTPGTWGTTSDHFLIVPREAENITPTTLGLRVFPARCITAARRSRMAAEDRAAVTTVDD